MAAKTMIVYPMHAPTDLSTARPTWAYVADDDLHNVYVFCPRPGDTYGRISKLTADELRKYPPYFPDPARIADFDLDKLIRMASSNHLGPAVGPVDHNTLEEALAYADSVLLPTESAT